MPVLNPSNQEELGKVALGNEKDVNIAVEAAKRAFETYSKTTKKDRLALLKELKFVTEKRFEDLAQAMRQEMGAPISMARSAQADAAIGHLDSFIDALNEYLIKRQCSPGIMKSLYVYFAENHFDSDALVDDIGNGPDSSNLIEALRTDSKNDDIRILVLFVEEMKCMLSLNALFERMHAH